VQVREARSLIFGRPHTHFDFPDPALGFRATFHSASLHLQIGRRRARLRLAGGKALLLRRRQRVVELLQRAADRIAGIAHRPQRRDQRI